MALILKRLPRVSVRMDVGGVSRVVTIKRGQDAEAICSDPKTLESLKRMTVSQRGKRYFIFQEYKNTPEVSFVEETVTEPEAEAPEAEAPEAEAPEAEAPEAPEAEAPEAEAPTEVFVEAKVVPVPAKSKPKKKKTAPKKAPSKTE